MTGNANLSRDLNVKFRKVVEIEAQVFKKLKGNEYQCYNLC